MILALPSKFVYSEPRTFPLVAAMLRETYEIFNNLHAV